MTVKQRLPTLIVFAFAMGTALQLWSSLQSYPEDLLRVWKSAGQHALWRGANFSINQTGADYIAFIHQHVPEDAQIVLPATGFKAPPLMRTPLMQFYLFPRAVINCSPGDATCLSRFSHAGSYLLVFEPNLLPGPLLENSEQLLMKTDTLGLYLPMGASPQAGVALPTFQSMARIALWATAPTLLLLLLTALGTIALQRVLDQTHFLARGAIGYGIGLGLFTLVVFLLSLVGLRFHRAVLLGLALTAGLCFATYGITRRLALQDKDRAQKDSVLQPGIDIWHIVFFTLSALLVLTAVGKGYFFGDEMVLWGPKGYGIAEAGISAGVSDWGTSTINYPLHVLILIATFKQWFGELLPASKMIFPLYFLSFLLLSYDFLRQRIARHIAGLSVLALASTPIFITHAEISYANLPFTYYYVAATLLGVSTLQERPLLANLARALLASFLFALGMWTRPEGIALSSLGMLVVMLTGWFQWNTADRKPLVLALFTPFVAVVVLWMTTSNRIYTQSLRAGSTFTEMLGQVLTGDFHMYELGITIRFFFTDAFYSYMDWGLLGLAISLLTLSLLVGKKYGLAKDMLILNGVMAGVGVVGIFYFASFNALGACDLSCYLTGGMHRFIMPGMAALWLGLCAAHFRSAPPRSPMS